MSRERLPPGQELAAPGKWPIVGERQPAPGHDHPVLQVCGEVARPRTFSFQELHELPQVSRTIDIHCVTRWSMLDAPFAGIPLSEILQIVEPLASARFVSFVSHSERRHSTSLPLTDALRLDVLIALQFEGHPLSREHGGPIRSVCPDRYFYKSIKWLERIELLQEDRLGYWEASAGYHNAGDPWLEQRFVATGISRQEAGRILATRDISNRDLLGLDASDRELSRLNAVNAILRNANFRRANLVAANFDRANLSNAQFQHANLQGATFRDADLEGACFGSCDLRGADLSGASLFGTQFIETDENSERPPLVAILDQTTRIDAAAISLMNPQQTRFVTEALQSPTRP